MKHNILWEKWGIIAPPRPDTIYVAYSEEEGRMLVPLIHCCICFINLGFLLFAFLYSASFWFYYSNRTNFISANLINVNSNKFCGHLLFVVEYFLTSDKLQILRNVC